MQLVWRSYCHNIMQVVYNLSSKSPSTQLNITLLFLLSVFNNFFKNKVTEYIINNKKMTDPVAIANSFNDYFINVGKSLANNIVSQIDPLSYIDR